MTTPNSPAGSQQAAVQAALVVLKSMGLSLEDLSAAPRERGVVPTFGEYVPVVSGAVGDGTRRAYGSYWNRVVGQWGGRRLDEPTPSEIRQLMKLVKASAVQRRNGRGGRSAEEHLVAALPGPPRSRAVRPALSPDVRQRSWPGPRLATGTSTRPGTGLVWTSPNGLTWHRFTAAQFGLVNAPGERVFAMTGTGTGRSVTLITGSAAKDGKTRAYVWRSLDNGASWRTVVVPQAYGGSWSVAGLAATRATSSRCGRARPPAATPTPASAPPTTPSTGGSPRRSPAPPGWCRSR
jgi:hypothetical protein